MNAIWKTNKLGLAGVGLFSAVVATVLVSTSFPSSLHEFHRASRYPLVAVAGSYYSGDGCAANSSITIKADGTYEQEAASCEGIQSLVQGKIHQMDNGALLLEDQQDLLHKQNPALNSILLYPVKWGDRMYLVRDFGNLKEVIPGLKDTDLDNARLNSYIRFCCDINCGGEPRQDLH